MVEGYGLANRICYGALGFLGKFLVETPKGGKYVLKTYAIPINPLTLLTISYQYSPQITRYGWISGGLFQMGTQVCGLYTQEVHKYHYYCVYYTAQVSGLGGCHVYKYIISTVCTSLQCYIIIEFALCIQNGRSVLSVRCSSVPPPITMSTISPLV